MIFAAAERARRRAATRARPPGPASLTIFTGERNEPITASRGDGDPPRSQLKVSSKASELA